MTYRASAPTNAPPKREPPRPGDRGTATKSKAGKLRSKDNSTAANGQAFPAQAAWRERNPLARWAHLALASGIRRGLVTPQPCEDCGAEKAEAHHDDYHRPLAVRWLCRRHHKAEHARRAKR